MTIKKRLFLSNILMIAVPAAIVAFVGLLCVVLLWSALQGNHAVRPEDGEDLTRVGRDMAGQIQDAMAAAPDTWADQVESLKSLAESGALRVMVVQNGGLAYDAGEEQPEDLQLAQAADSISGPEVLLSAGERSVYRASAEYRGGAWSLYLFGTRQEHLAGGWKVFLALVAVGLVFVVFLTILMTNRFLTRFVIRRIEEPLDLLSEGAPSYRLGGERLSELGG